MHCPRCHGPMFSHDAPLADGGSVVVDRCQRASSCGVFYDAGELAAASPRFAERGVREALESAASSPRARPSECACPRCATPVAEAGPFMKRFVFASTEVDRCERCGGLWIETARVPALLSALTLYDPGEGELRAGNYRTAAAAVEMRPRAGNFGRCVRCGAQAAVDQLLVGARGFLCVLCAATAEQ